MQTGVEVGGKRSKMFTGKELQYEGWERDFGRILVLDWTFRLRNTSQIRDQWVSFYEKV